MATQNHQKHGSKRRRSKRDLGAGASTRRGAARPPGTEAEIDATTFLRDQSSPEAAVARRIAAGEGDRHDADGDRANLAERVRQAGQDLFERVARLLRDRPVDVAAAGLALFTVLGRRARRA